MSLVSALLTPFALLLPADDAGQSERPGVGHEVYQVSDIMQEEPVRAAPKKPVSVSFEVWPQHFMTRKFLPDSAFQVRIEQSVRIRIVPRPRARPQARRVRPDMLVGVPGRALGTSYVERRMGKCLRVKSIAGVQANGGNDLVLFLRDRRMVRAKLERACSARDFYSGFYLSRSSDGKLCVNRDSLQSRSGANCKITLMRQLIETDN